VSTIKEPASSLAIALFGTLDVRLQGQPLQRSHSQKTQWLLALLVLQEGRAVDRGWLAGTLWPDSSEEQAAANLRRNLWYLRQALGSEGHRLESPVSGKLRLELVGAEADVLVFDEAIARGDARSLERAVALHRGPLLQGCGEEWVLQEREAREQAYLAALETLAAAATASGEHATAVHHLRRLVTGDPLRDSAHRALMQALAAAGDIAAATQTYRDFRHFLHQELNAAPDAETTALYQEIRASGRERARSDASGRAGEWASGRSDDGVEEGEGASPSVRPLVRSPARPLARSPAHPLAPSAPPRLPLPLTRLVGREQEVAAIRARLEQGPLVTLTGVGGIGKTRLAIRVAEMLAEELPDGAWFVDLAPLPARVPARLGADGQSSRAPGGGRSTSLHPRPAPARDASERSDAEVSSLVARTVARVLEVREQANEAASAALVEALREKRLLLVLDNCEHLLDACAALAETLLASCPRLQILATSRQPLGLTGEIVWRVDPLSLPDETLWEVGKEPPSAAVRLFLERAMAAAPRFRVTERNTAAVAEVCRRLDGIPLAIELAATRLKALSVEELASRLEDRFRLLTQGSRTAQPRQQTLQAAMDWSHDLLSEAERAVLRRLSVFAGGWTLAAAEGVCADTEGRRQEAEGSPDGWNAGSRADAPSRLPSAFCLLPSDVLDLLTALVEKSWVAFSYDEREGEGRYRLLETVRQYAQERLREAGEEVSARRRHLSFFLRLAEEAEKRLRGPELVTWLDRLEREHDNLHAALDWSREAEEGWREGRALTLALFSYWDLRHGMGAGVGYLKHFAERSDDLPLAERARLVRLAGFACRRLAEYAEARRYLEESRSLRRQHGEAEEDPNLLQGLAALAVKEGDDAEAEVLLQQCLRIYRGYEEDGRDFERDHLGWALDLLGGMAYCRGEVAAARSYYEQCLDVFRELEDISGIAGALLGLGRVAMRQGEPSRARTLLEESLALFREVKAQSSVIEVLNSLAWIAWHTGEYGAARGILGESLARCRETARHGDTSDSLIAVGHLTQREGNPGQAVRFFGAAGRLGTATGGRMMGMERADLEEAITASRTALGEEAFAAACEQGRGMTREQAIRFALEAVEEGGGA
jgi:predicted ATPase/DNA-binding SARP family transcriptional activator